MRQGQSSLHRRIRKLEHEIKRHESLDVRHSIQVRALAVELLRAEHRERKRIAALLHDRIQQLLVFVKMKLGQLEDSEEPKTPRELKILEESLQALEDAIEASRNLTIELNPPVLFESGLAEALVWLGRQMQRKHDLRVHVDADAAAEPTGESTRVFLFEAVSELLFNVIKHARVKEAWVWMQRASDDRVEIIVEDHGVGLDVASLHDAPRRGYGLGRILDRIEVLGGMLRQEEIEGRGTRLILDAPIIEDDDSILRSPIIFSDGSALSVDPEMETATVAGPGQPRKIRVLLADDHEILRTGLAEILKGFADIEVVGEASNGRMAVNLAHSTKPDVVIMDYEMPSLNGVGATRQIKQELPETQVLGLTMYNDDGMREVMLSAGASMCLAKGCHTNTLVRAVRQVSGRALNKGDGG